LLKTASSVVVARTHGLYDRLASFEGAPLDRQARVAALDRFFSTRSGRERPGRYWRVDLEGIAPAVECVDASFGTVRIVNPNARVVACDLSTAASAHADLFAQVFGATGVAQSKFGALATAFAHLGAFVYVSADVAAAEPVMVTYDAPDGTAIFPYTLVLAERGARVTVIERCDGGNAFACGVSEIVTNEGADVTFATVQQLGSEGRAVFTRRAAPGRDATVTWADAQLGAVLAACDISTAVTNPGTHAGVTALFFPNARQHVDVVSTIDHLVGDSTSETLVKSAAVDAGQARYLGNIRIAPHAQGSDASLRDDALLLSPDAHVDSVPALEIGANDVKAFHGATVGALDAEQIFYMTTRGIERDAAERMIALGFFEPAIARFPTEALRERIRAALAAKLS